MKTKRTRRTREQLRDLLNAIKGIVSEWEKRQTIRHLYYVLAGRGLIEKTERAFATVGEHLSKWRRADEIAWSVFLDSSRMYLGHAGFDGVKDALTYITGNYRHKRWATQRYYVEVWIEKAAMADEVAATADEYCVQTFICKGFSSLTSIFEVSEKFAEMKRGKKPVILHLGDYDPSGKEGASFIERSLRDDFNRFDVDFRSIAVTKEQIAEFELPTRPTKTVSKSGRANPHLRNWEEGEESVELDTMTTEQIQGIVRDAIKSLIDRRKWSAMLAREKKERRELLKLAGKAK
jgi:hypothetical protein